MIHFFILMFSVWGLLLGSLIYWLIVPRRAARIVALATELRKRILTTSRSPQLVVVVNAGLWDAAYGQLKAYRPEGQISTLLAAARQAQDCGVKVVWRTTSAVHPHI